MSFFARAANLIKGSFKSMGRPSREDELRNRAIEEELAKEGTWRAPEPRAEGRAPPARDSTMREPAKPPDRDASGNVKRTL